MAELEGDGEWEEDLSLYSRVGGLSVYEKEWADGRKSGRLSAYGRKIECIWEECLMYMGRR